MENFVAENEATYRSQAMRVLKSALALLAILVIGYFYFIEFSKNLIAFKGFEFSFDATYLLVAVCFCLLSYLADVVIWRLIINAQHNRDRISFKDIFAVVFGSGLFRYLPGRILVFAIQALWLGKYGISKSVTLYINLVCIIQLFFFSGYSLLLFMIVYVRQLSTTFIVLLFALLIITNLFFNLYNRFLINGIFSAVGKLTKREVTAIETPPCVMAVVQSIYMSSWLLVGLAAYFLARGLGLQIGPADAIAVVASISSSWLAGYLAVVAPAGLGVREGVMLLMLKPVVAVQTALLLPIFTRIFFMVTEAFLGLAAMLMGAREKVFMLKKARD